jgi:hypothetical protein
MLNLTAAIKLQKTLVLGSAQLKTTVLKYRPLAVEGLEPVLLNGAANKN